MHGDLKTLHQRHAAEYNVRLTTARRVISALLDCLGPVASALDVGCGIGTWLRGLRDAGVGELCGIDGEWLEPAAAVVECELLRTDLEKPITLERRFDLVLSIEVAEHIAREAAGQFIRNLVAHGDLVLFSAAIPGQRGEGHVNEQFLQYWSDRFAGHGYRPYDLLRPRLWSDGAVFLYLRQNLMLFANDAAVERFPVLRQVGVCPIVSVVHPEYYLRLLNEKRG